MQPDGPHIFVTFSDIPHHLDRGILDHEQLLGETTYLTHCLIFHLLTFHIICTNIYLICDYIMLL